MKINLNRSFINIARSLCFNASKLFIYILYNIILCFYSKFPIWYLKNFQHFAILNFASIHKLLLYNYVEIYSALAHLMKIWCKNRIIVTYKYEKRSTWKYTTYEFDMTLLKFTKTQKQTLHRRETKLTHNRNSHTEYQKHI